MILPANIDISPEHIHAIRTWAKSKERVRAIRLFGSRAKGTNGPESDIDLAMTVSENRHYTRSTIWMFDAPEWSSVLSGLVGLPVDVRITDVGKPCHIRRYCREAGSILLYRAR